MKVALANNSFTLINNAEGFISMRHKHNKVEFDIVMSAYLGGSYDR